MDFFRKMSFADSTGDAIPFYHEGKYHIFSLTSPPGTTVYPARLRTTWSHSVSEDLVHWEELPTALYPGEGDEPDASGVWTGSVIYGEGKYHAFYTGYCLTAEYQQTICHATSEDGITWTKDAANPVITPMIELYEKLDWRDPYVFYNEEDKCYWILISARRLDMPVTRRGCIVLYRSGKLGVLWSVVFGRQYELSGMQRDVQDRRYLVSFLFPLFRVCQHDLPHFQISVWTVEKAEERRHRRTPLLCS